MRESKVRDYLMIRVKNAGGEMRKVRWVGRRGAPDELILFDDFHSFAELKATGEIPEPHQYGEHDVLRRAGLRVDVIDSLDDVDRLIGEMKRGI